MVTIIAMQNLIEVSSTSKLCLVASAHKLKIVRAAYLRGDRPESAIICATIRTSPSVVNLSALEM